MKTRNMTKLASEQVSSILSDIKTNKDNSPTPAKIAKIPTEEVSSTNLKKAKSTHNAVKGKPKSGRFWKSERERFSTVNKTKGLKQDFKKKTALRIELKRTKELAKQALEQLNEKRVRQKERRRENLKRAEENKRKSEIVQVITNSAKIKRMRKKQLRFIQKRDTNQQVEASK